MDSQKENCWMKDYEHWGFCNKATPTVGPLGIYPLFNGAGGGMAFPHPVRPHGGAVLKGLAKNPPIFTTPDRIVPR